MDNPRQAGRPSKAEQLVIKLKLLACFSEGYKPARAAREVEVNPKTARKYYRYLHNTIIENKETEFFNECRISKEEADLKISIIIDKLEQQEKTFATKINSLGQNLSPENQWMYTEYRKTQESIAKLELEKHNLKNSPTADLTLRKEANDILKKQLDLGGPSNA